MSRATHQAAVHRLMQEWATLWELPGFQHGISLAFNPRLHRSLGRCTPARGRVVIQAGLLDGPLNRLSDVVCHEVAHVAAFLLSGSTRQPHGELWQELVSAAGFQPRVTAA